MPLSRTDHYYCRRDELFDVQIAAMSSPRADRSSNLCCYSSLPRRSGESAHNRIKKKKNDSYNINQKNNPRVLEQLMQLMTFHVCHRRITGLVPLSSFQNISFSQLE